MEFQNVQRLAIFKFRHIGDVLMMTPALRGLRELFPQAHITVFVNQGTEAMLAHSPDVNEVVALERVGFGQGFWKKLFYELGFLNQIRKGRYDLTINFTEGDRGAWYSMISGARYRMGWTNYRWGRFEPKNLAYTHALRPCGNGHEVENHYDLLNHFNLDLPLYPLRLVVPLEAETWAQEQMPGLPYVHVHPVARWLWKCWSEEKMSKLIDWLQGEKGFRVVVTSGPNGRELERARVIVAGCRVRPHFIEGTASLTQTAALSARAALFIGVDTAPMHMAAAVGTPVVALFGPTYSKTWHPWQTVHQVVSTPCYCNLAQKDQAPPGHQLCDKNKTRACLAAITLESVQEAVEEMLVSVVK